MLAFAAYIKVDGPATIICRLNYNGSNSVENEIMIKDELNPNIWNSIGFNKQAHNQGCNAGTSRKRERLIRQL